MTDEASIDEQVERAMIEWRKCWETDTSYRFTPRIMRDLLAGKFREEALPEIVLPHWISGKASIHTNSGKLIRVEFSEPSINGWHVWGPFRPTKRAAIEAWNAVFTKSDER
jgi:hypothetical protein